MSVKSLLCAGVATGCFVAGAHAAPITVVSHTADFEPRVRQSTGNYDSAGSVAATSLRIGDSSTFDFTTALFFQLPAVNAADLTAANLNFTQVASVGDAPTYDADLWGLGFTNVDPPANTAAESQLYFYIGDGPDTGEGVGGPTVVRTKLQDDILIPSMWISADSSAHQTDATGDAALLNFIQGVYADPNFSPGSSYLILRLNPDVAPLPDTTTRYTIASGDAADATVPVLSLEVIPEPGGLALLGLGGLGLIRRRRSSR